MNTMTYLDVVQHYGGGNTYKAAAELGLSPQTLYNWNKHGVPLEWQGWIERDTAGRLKGDHRRPNTIPRAPQTAEPETQQPEAA